NPVGRPAAVLTESLPRRSLPRPEPTPGPSSAPRSAALPTPSFPGLGTHPGERVAALDRAEKSYSAARPRPAGEGWGRASSGRRTPIGCPRGSGGIDRRAGKASSSHQALADYRLLTIALRTPYQTLI